METPRKIEPTIGRVPKGVGDNKLVTLKIKVGKKVLHADHDLARLMCGAMLINGAQYCRPHLRTHCHLCEVDHRSFNEEVDEERRRLGLPPCGDATLNAESAKRADFTIGRIMQRKMKIQNLIRRYGPNHNVTHPEHWQNFMLETSRDEREINDRYLAEVQKVEVSQCCYWACKQPDAKKLLKCSGCGIVKYCCKEHQVKDWEWEHKGECKLPQFLKDEYEEDRQRNLAGDYTSRDEMM